MTPEGQAPQGALTAERRAEMRRRSTFWIQEAADERDHVQVNDRELLALLDALDAAEAERDRLAARDSLRPGRDWHEDIGNVLWTRLPIVEPPYCGTPLDEDWPCAWDDQSELWWVPLPDVFGRGPLTFAAPRTPEATS